MRGPRERQARLKRFPFLVTARECEAHRRSEEITGAVIERLRGQWLRPALLPRRTRGDSAAHLNQAVEAATGAPWAAESIRVVADDLESWLELTKAFGREREPLERVRSKTVNEHICLAYEAFEDRTILWFFQVERRAPLSTRGLREQGRHFFESGWIDSENVCAMRCQEARADRASDHAREIEHPQSAQRTRRIRNHAQRRAPRRDGRERLFGDCPSLRVSAPLLGRAKHGGAAIFGDDPRLDFLGIERLDSFCDGFAIVCDVECANDGSAMIGVVRVEANEAIARAVVAGDRIPQLRQAPTFGLLQALAHERGFSVGSFDHGGARRFLTPHGEKRRGSGGGDRNASRSKLRDPENGGQSTAGPGESDRGQWVFRAPEFGPQ